MTDLFPFFSNTGLTFFFKIVLLICLGLFVVFTIFILNYIQSLKKIVAIKDVTGSTLISIFAIAYAIAAVSLFFLALVIL